MPYRESINMSGGRYRVFEISQESIDEMRMFIAEYRQREHMVKPVIDALMHVYALTTVGEAQKRSAGPRDLGGTQRALAWKIPVRRIRGHYFEGWKTGHIGIGAWMAFNTSREAYFIEFGINHSGSGSFGPTGIPSGGGLVRIRRPILKLSVIATLKITGATNLSGKALVRLFDGIPHTSGHSPNLMPWAKSTGMGGGDVGLPYFGGSVTAASPDYGLQMPNIQVSGFV